MDEIPDAINNPKEVSDAPINLPMKNTDGRNLGHKSVDTGKVTGVSDIAANSITSAMLQSAIVSQSKLKYETATLAFGSGDTTKTASVTSGSIIIGVYSSAVTSTPAYGELQLAVSSTTLTGTRSAAPGGAAAITYTVILLKS